MAALYDTIGLDYANLRKPDPRIEAAIWGALGPAKTVLNVGAGAGSYEPRGCQVTAVEPSTEMTRQRRLPAYQVIQGTAEALPFDDNSLDAAMAILTVHHWTDPAKGMSEMRRVTRGPIVILTYDPAFRGFWLADYVPELVSLDEGQMPPISAFSEWLGPVDVLPIPIPHDCSDGFLSAYWRRPAAYLDPKVRSAISSFWKIQGVEEGMAMLSKDLESGAWDEKYGPQMQLQSQDLGYRLVVCRGG